MDISLLTIESHLNICFFGLTRNPRNRLRFLRGWVTLIISTLFLTASLYAQDDKVLEGDSNDETVVKVVNGLKFQVPEDRSIERKNNIVAPVPIDKYIALKFSKLDSRLQEFEDKIDQIEKEISLLRQEITSLKGKQTNLLESQAIEKQK